MSLRDAVAFEQGADESLLGLAATPPRGGQVDVPPNVAMLHDRHAAALEVADAYLGLPGEVGIDAWSRLTTVLSPIEIAELALRLSKFSRNKVRVSLGLDVGDVERRFYRPPDLATDRAPKPRELP